MPTAKFHARNDFDLYSISELLIKKYSAGKRGEIIITAATQESVVLAVENESLQGMRIQRTPDEIEVAVRPLSSTGDYRLFADTVKGLAALLDSGTELENIGILATVEAVDSFRWDEWIEYVTDGDYRTLKEYVDTYGATRTYAGVFFPFCVGPRFLGNEEKTKTAVLQSLTTLQWRYKDVPRAQQGILGDEATRQRITLTVFGTTFNIDHRGMLIPLAESLAIADADNIKGIMRFRHASSVFPTGIRIDEEQVFLPAAPDENDRERILALGAIFSERNVFKDYSMPGFGMDEGQRTFILTWNPEISSVKTDDFLYWMKYMRAQDANWNIGSHEQVRPGDRWFMLACGNGVKKGIVGSGLFDSNAWQGDDKNNDGKHLYFCDILPDALVNPLDGEPVSVAELKYRMPDIEWDTIESGTMLPDDYASQMEELWSRRIAGWMAGEQNHVRIMPPV